MSENFNYRKRGGCGRDGACVFSLSLSQALSRALSLMFVWVGAGEWKRDWVGCIGVKRGRGVCVFYGKRLMVGDWRVMSENVTTGLYFFFRWVVVVPYCRYIYIYIFIYFR